MAHFSTGEGFDDSDWAFALVVRRGGCCRRSCCRGRRGRGRTGERKLFRVAVRSAQGSGVRGQGPRGTTEGAVEPSDRAGRKPRLSARLCRRPARVKSHDAFERKPQQAGAAPRSRTDAAFAAALAASPGAWSALGPVTRERLRRGFAVLRPGHAEGPTTQESGRVTALAIDPNCAKASAPAGAPCRLWVAAAGGGIWRTNNALAAQPSWIAPPDDLPTNAFGSLIVDPNDPSGNTLYAGSGEPNGSGDSEAGLGLFKSTDGGTSWQLVAGSQAVATTARSARSPSSQAIRARSTSAPTSRATARRPSTAVGARHRSSDARRLHLDRRRRALHAVDRTPGKTPPNPSPAGAGRASTGSRAGSRSSSTTRTTQARSTRPWSATASGARPTAAPTWTQVFQTFNRTLRHEGPRDTFGDRTEFDAVNARRRQDAHLPRRLVRRPRASRGSAARTTPPRSPVTRPARYWNAGWTELSSSQNGTNGFLAYGYCQNGQCGYDDFVTSPASQPGVGAGSRRASCGSAAR